MAGTGLRSNRFTVSTSINQHAMKNKIAIPVLLLLPLLILSPAASRAQSVAQCLQQLALDYQKLSGLKSMLRQMYTGYEVLRQGYHRVGAISQDSYDLHRAFLDGLLVAGPTIRAYPRAAGIIEDQRALMKEYAEARSVFGHDKHFNPEELSYLSGVYNSLITQSLQNLSDLALVLSDGQLRMSDAERLSAIDHIYQMSHDQLSFLRSFNDRNRQVAISRAAAENDRLTLKALYDIN